jgi:hypothetical protein
VRVLPDQRARGACVIEMDVGQQQPMQFVSRDAGFGQAGDEARQAAGRAGIHHERPRRRADDARRDPAGAAEELQIDDPGP